MWKKNFNKLKENLSSFLNDICLKRQDFYRDLNPMDRIYNVFHTTLFCFVAQNGAGLFFIMPSEIAFRGLYFVVFLLIYGVVTLLSGVCYAEMAELMPSTGAAYHYCYYSMGEFIAFLSGWNMIYTNVLTTYLKCSFAKYVLDDVLFMNWIENNTHIIPEYNLLDIFQVGGSIDIIYPFIILSVAAMSTAFVKRGIYICSICALVLILSVLFYIVLFLFYANKEIIYATERVPEPFASTSFVRAAVIYSGCEVISILGEEAIKPKETIPKSIMISVRWTMVVVVLWGIVLSVASSGWMTGPHNWPFRATLEAMNLGGLKWVAFFGFLSGIWASIFSSFFLLIRLLYAMSRDGMLFNIFSKIDRATTAPLVPALIVAACMILLEIFISESTLARFFSLMSTKIIIYVCLMYTRYEYKSENDVSPEFDFADRWLLINWPRRKEKPTPVTHRLSMILILLLTMSSYLLIQCMMMMRMHDTRNPWVKVMTVFSLVILILSFIFLSQQPQNDRSDLKHKVPDVPFVPVVAMITDFMVCLNDIMRPILCLPVFLWWLIGIIFYFSFSRKNSVERRMLNPDGTKWEIMDKEFDSFGGLLRQNSVFIRSKELVHERDKPILSDDLVISERGREQLFINSLPTEQSSTVIDSSSHFSVIGEPETLHNPTEEETLPNPMEEETLPNPMQEHISNTISELHNSGDSMGTAEEPHETLQETEERLGNE